MRSTSTEFLGKFENKVRDATMGVASAYGADITIEQITPLYKTYINNRTLNSLLKENLAKMNINAEDAGSEEGFASGSTDEANVSWVVPTGHLDFPIGYPGIPGHSDEFREAANPDKVENVLRNAIKATALTILQIAKENKIRQIKDEFENSDGNGQ